ncbi:unnamed protein product, partial [Heterotrigona itama]
MDYDSMKQWVTAFGSWRWWKNNTARQGIRRIIVTAAISEDVAREKQSSDEKCRYQMK